MFSHTTSNLCIQQLFQHVFAVFFWLNFECLKMWTEIEFLSFSFTKFKLIDFKKNSFQKWKVNFKTISVYYISSKEDETFTVIFTPKWGFLTFATCQLNCQFVKVSFSSASKKAKLKPRIEKHKQWREKGRDLTL